MASRWLPAPIRPSPANGYLCLSLSPFGSESRALPTWGAVVSSASTDLSPISAYLPIVPHRRRYTARPFANLSLSFVLSSRPRVCDISPCSLLLLHAVSVHRLTVMQTSRTFGAVTESQVRDATPSVGPQITPSASSRSII